MAPEPSPDGQNLSLAALSTALQESVSDPSDALGSFVVAYPVTRLDLAILSRELSELQLVARLLGHNAESLDEGGAAEDVPDKLSKALRDVVESAGILVAEVEDALEGDGEMVERGDAWLEHTAERLLPLGRMAENARVGMNLGLDVLLFAINFQPSPAEDALPAYSDSQILSETQTLRGRLVDDAENDDLRVQDQIKVLVEFLDALQEYMQQMTGGQQSTSTAIPGTTVSSLHSEAIPDYHAIGITNPTPLTISLRHLAKKELSNHEVVEVAFLLRHAQPTIAVSTMDPPTRFYDTQANQVSVLSNQHGVDLTFCRDGRTWAYVVEEDPKELNALGHDGAHFRKPSVYLGDYLNGRRIQQMRWPGARPLCFSPDGTWLAVGSARHRIALVDVKAGAVLYKAAILACHSDTVTHAVFTPDSSALVSQSRDGTIRLTSPATGRSLAKLDLDTWKRPSFLGVTPDGAVVVSIWGDVVYHWNHAASALESYALSSRRAREGWPVAVSGDCRFLCCRTEDGADISDLYSGRVLYTIKFESGYVTAATFSHDGRYLILGKAAQWMGVRVTMSTLDVWELVF